MKKMQPNFQEPVVEYCEPEQVIDIWLKHARCVQLEMRKMTRKSTFFIRLIMLLN